MITLAENIFKKVNSLKPRFYKRCFMIAFERRHAIGISWTYSKSGKGRALYFAYDKSLVEYRNRKVRNLLMWSVDHEAMHAVLAPLSFGFFEKKYPEITKDFIEWIMDPTDVVGGISLGSLEGYLKEKYPQNPEYVRLLDRIGIAATIIDHAIFAEWVQLKYEKLYTELRKEKNAKAIKEIFEKPRRLRYPLMLKLLKKISKEIPIEDVKAVAGVLVNEIDYQPSNFKKSVIMHEGTSIKDVVKPLSALLTKREKSTMNWITSIMRQDPRITKIVDAIFEKKWSDVDLEYLEILQEILET